MKPNTQLTFNDDGAIIPFYKKTTGQIVFFDIITNKRRFNQENLSKLEKPILEMLAEMAGVSKTGKKSKVAGEVNAVAKISHTPNMTPEEIRSIAGMIGLSESSSHTDLTQWLYGKQIKAKEGLKAVTRFCMRSEKLSSKGIPHFLKKLALTLHPEFGVICVEGYESYRTPSEKQDEINKIIQNQKDNPTKFDKRFARRLKVEYDWPSFSEGSTPYRRSYAFREVEDRRESLKNRKPVEQTSDYIKFKKKKEYAKNKIKEILFSQAFSEHEKYKKANWWTRRVCGAERGIKALKRSEDIFIEHMPKLIELFDKERARREKLGEVFDDNGLPLKKRTKHFSENAYITHKIRRGHTEAEIISAIKDLQSLNKKPTKAAIARMIGQTRVNISKNYSHLFKNIS